MSSLRSTKEVYNILVKETYYFELDRKEKIYTRINYVTTIFVLIISLTAFYLNNLSDILSKPELSLSRYFFIVLLILSGVSAIASFLALVRTLIGYEYQLLPVPVDIDHDLEEINKYAEEIEKVKLNLGMSDYDIQEQYGFTNIEDEFEQYLADKFKAAATANTLSNDQKDNRLNLSIRLFILTLSLLFLTGLPYFYIKFQ